MKIQVVYAKPDQQSIVELDVPDGTTVFEAAVRSGLANQFPDIDLDTIPMGSLVSVLKRPPPRSFILAIGWSCIDLC